MQMRGFLRGMLGVLGGMQTMAVREMRMVASRLVIA
jgi:hypothetical protein